MSYGYASGGRMIDDPPPWHVRQPKRPNPSVPDRRQGWRGRPRQWKNPADQGPPLEDLDRVIERAEAQARLEWRMDHGELPWEWPASTLFSPTDLSAPTRHDLELRADMGWPDRWFRTHLFELPPLGLVPDRWLWLLR